MNLRHKSEQGGRKRSIFHTNNNSGGGSYLNFLSYVNRRKEGGDKLAQ